MINTLIVYTISTGLLTRCAGACAVAVARGS